MASCCTSVLLPAFSFQSQDVSQIQQTCRSQFGVESNQDFELFALVPLTQDALS